MKHLLLFASLFAVLGATAQRYQIPGGYGTESYRFLPDSVLHVPHVNDTLSHDRVDTTAEIRAILGSLWFYPGGGRPWQKLGSGGGGTANAVVNQVDTVQHPGLNVATVRTDSLLARVQTLLHTTGSGTDSGYWFHGNDGDAPGYAQLTGYGVGPYIYYHESAGGNDWWDQHMGLQLGSKIVPTWGLIPGAHTGFQTMVFKSVPTYIFNPKQHIEGAGTPPLDFSTTDYSDNYNFAINNVDQGFAWSLDAWTQGPGNWYAGFTGVFNNRHMGDMDTAGIVHANGLSFQVRPNATTPGDSTAMLHYSAGHWFITYGPPAMSAGSTWDNIMANGSTTTHVPQVTISNGLGYELTGTSNNQQTAYAVINDVGTIGEFGITGSSYSSTGAFQPSHTYLYGQNGLSIVADGAGIVFGKSTGSNYGGFDFSTGNWNIANSFQSSAMSTTDTTLVVKPSNGGTLVNAHIYPTTIGALPADSLTGSRLQLAYFNSSGGITGDSALTIIHRVTLGRPQDAIRVGSQSAVPSIQWASIANNGFTANASNGSAVYSSNSIIMGDNAGHQHTIAAGVTVQPNIVHYFGTPSSYNPLVGTDTLVDRGDTVATNPIDFATQYDLTQKAPASGSPNYAPASGSSNYAPATSSTHYVQNQSAVQQSSTSFSVDGTGNVGTSFTVGGGNYLNVTSSSVSFLFGAITMNTAGTVTAGKYITTSQGFVSSTNSATATAQTGAGTSPTVSVTGSMAGGLITVTTGSSPAGSNANIVIIGYNHSFPTGSWVTITPNNAAAINYGTVGANGAINNFTLIGGNTALAASTTYTWNYTVQGY